MIRYDCVVYDVIIVAEKIKGYAIVVFADAVINDGVATGIIVEVYTIIVIRYDGVV